MGRKAIKFTKEQIEQVEKLSSVLNQEQMADFFGIGEVTFRNLKKRQPEIDVAYKKGRSAVIGKMGQTLLKQALDGNTTAIIFYLKTQAGWKETHVHENQNMDVKEFKDMYGDPEPES